MHLLTSISLNTRKTSRQSFKVNFKSFIVNFMLFNFNFINIKHFHWFSSITLYYVNITILLNRYNYSIILENCISVYWNISMHSYTERHSPVCNTQTKCKFNKLVWKSYKSSLVKQTTRLLFDTNLETDIKCKVEKEIPFLLCTLSVPSRLM